MTDIYLNDERCARLVAALANVKPCLMTGVVTENEIKTALGEHGDIWPASIRANEVA